MWTLAGYCCNAELVGHKLEMKSLEELRRIIEGWYLCAYRKVRVYLLGGKKTSLDGDLNLHQQFVPIQPCYFIHVLGDLHRILQMLHWVDCPCSFYLILAWQPNLDWDFMAGHIRRCSSTWAVFDWKRRGGFLNCNVCLRWWPHQYCHLQVDLSLVVEFIHCLYVAPLTRVFEHPCWSILIETSILVYERAGSVVLVKTLPSCLIHWRCSVGGAQFCVDATQSYVSTRKQVSESTGTGNRFFGSEQF